MRRAQAGTAFLVLSISMAAAATSHRALADSPMPVEVRADEVTFDVAQKTLDARGHVRVDEPPFFVTAERVHLERVPLGVRLTGDGTLGFCPCLGTPLAVSFDGATIAPPYDIIVDDPTLRVYGVPVLWAPVAWLRTPARPGLLPPTLAYRGADGMFAGDGFHLPWRSGVPDGHGLDVRAGGYFLGGVAVDADLYTTATRTRVRWDRLRGDDGVMVDARGSTAIGRDAGDDRATTAVAWEADLARGPRGVRAITDVEAAARPYDRASFESAWRAPQWTVASGVRSSSYRGETGVLDFGAAGPAVIARAGGSLAGAATYDVAVEGGALRPIASPLLSFARSELGALTATTFGALGADLSVRGAGSVASNGVDQGVDALASARARLTLPMSRAFASDAPDDPWVHRVDPRIEASALYLREDGVLAAALGRGAVIAPGGAFVADAGLANAVGRFGSRSAAEVDVSGGVVADAVAVHAAIRARASLGSRYVGVAGEGADVFAAGSNGHAVLARARLGAVDGLRLLATAAGRSGVDPVVARALTDPTLEPSSGLLADAGWTGGARVVIPWTHAIATRGGADVDLDSRRLVAASGGVELRDSCGCVVVRANASHRIGREGVDVWLTVDLSRAPSVDGR